MRLKLTSPVRHSSRTSGGRTTITDLEITRGRDREWAREQNVVYLTGYTSPSRAIKGISSFELCLDYADLKTLYEHLQVEYDSEMTYRAQLAQCRDELEYEASSPTGRQVLARCTMPKNHDGAHGDGRRRWS